MNKTQTRIYQMLCHFALHHNKSHGWVAHQYKDKYGDWPVYFDFELEPIEPSKRLLAEIRKNLRAYAKRQEKARRRQELKNGAPRKRSPINTSGYSHMRAIMREGRTV